MNEFTAHEKKSHTKLNRINIYKNKLYSYSHISEGKGETIRAYNLERQQRFGIYDNMSLKSY